MIADWKADVAVGWNRVVPFVMDAVLGLAFTYSRQHTARGGNRTLDILHLATAVHLRATEFLTFDARQKKLARHAVYTLDLDSIKLLHEDGHQEGVTSGFTRQGIKPCLHPLLGILAELRMGLPFGCVRAMNPARTM